MKRNEQLIENTWKLEDIYENEDLYAQEFKQLDTMITNFKDYEGTLNTSEQLYKALKDYEQMNYIFGRIYVYATQRYHEDTANSKYQQMCGDAEMLMTKFGANAAFLEPEVLAMDESVLKDEKLKPYQRFLETIFREKEHILDVKTEALLARSQDFGKAFSNIFSMFNDADLHFDDVLDAKGEKHTLTHGSYITLISSKDRVLRENTFKSVYKAYADYNNTLANIYYGNALQSNFYAKEHNFEGTLENELFNSEIPTSVYTSLIDSMHEYLPAMYKYVSLRKKVLNLDELHMYDVYVDLATTPDKKYSFEEAKEIVKKGLAPLGKDYIALLEEGFNNRWIDVYENEGKHSGAYSWGCYGTHPYVLLNYNGTLDSIFTLAHEMGHSIHTYYSNKNQSILNSEYRIFVAEVASTCNEALLINYLMNTTKDKEEKKYLINYFLDQFKGTMYRQTMFAEFELKTHDLVKNNTTLTAKTCNDIYLNLNKQYFGNDMISDEEIQYEWSRIPHFYTPFYVYQYATGFAAAIAISTKILKGEEGIVDKYKQFLSGGCSKSPIDLLKICDVDMTSKEPVENALQVFKEYVDTLESLL